MADCKVRPDKIPTRKDAFGYKAACGKYNGKFVKLARPLDSTTSNEELVTPIAPPVFDNPKSMPAGVYTYMLFEDGTFLAVPVENVFEVSSIHMRLVYEYSKRGAPVIVAAGEVKKSTHGQFQFNIESGTYMKDLSGDCQSKASEAIRSYLVKFAGEDDVNTEEVTFIDDMIIPLSKAQLDKYVKAGLEVRMYDNLKLCKNFLTHPEMAKSRLDGYVKDKTPEQLEGDAVYARYLKDYENAKAAYTVYTSGGKRTRRYGKKKLRAKTAKTTKAKKPSM